MRRLPLHAAVWTMAIMLLLAIPLAAGALCNAPCADCHNSNSPTAAWREAMCLTCHGPGGFASSRASSHAALDCFDCHETHSGAQNWLGGINRSHLRADVDVTGQHSNSSQPRLYDGLPVIETPPENRAQVVFESRGTGAFEPSLHSFADGDADGNGVYDGICEVCHRAYLQEARHHIGETCTACHPHNSGFR